MVALKTFNNLPPERQEEIIIVCLEEFALHEYRAASLSAIVANLKLAKGSFYRYFENKQTLYYFLLEHCTSMRLKNDEQYIGRQGEAFFELIAQHVAAKIHFDKDFPLHSAFLYNVMHERNNDELGNIQLTSKLKMLGLIEPLVELQIKKNTLRSDLDINTISFMILQTQLLILEYIALIYRIDFRENIRHKRRLYDLPENELIKVTNHFVEILKNGIIKDGTQK